MRTKDEIEKELDTVERTRNMNISEYTAYIKALKWVLEHCDNDC